MKDVLILVGYRAVGKTTLGQRLAECLGYEFLDTDHLICHEANKPIQKIVEEGGWELFRRYEKDILVTLSEKKRCVIATGGGAILHRSEWQELRALSTVIWLTATREVLMQRLQNDGSTVTMRPTLTGKGVTEELEEVLTFREPLYEATSHFSIDTGKISIEEGVKKIMTQLSSPSHGKV